jgi:hypothetical protein
VPKGDDAKRDAKLAQLERAILVGHLRFDIDDAFGRTRLPLLEPKSNALSTSVHIAFYDEGIGRFPQPTKKVSTLAVDVLKDFCAVKT